MKRCCARASSGPTDVGETPIAASISREISGDYIEPCVRRAWRLVDHSDERLLRQIFGEVAIAEASVEKPDEARVVTFEQLMNVQAISFDSGNGFRCGGATTRETLSPRKVRRGAT